MSLETATYIDSLVVSNPDGGDQASTLDDHIRLLKACLKRTWPNVTGEVSVSHGALNLAAQLMGTGTNTTVSATHSYSAMPQLLRSAVAYDMQGNYGALVYASGTFGSPAIAGWSSTYLGSGLYRVFHPINRQPWGDRMAVALQPNVGGQVAYVTSASASAYVEYGLTDVSASAQVGTCMVLINTW